MHASIDDWRTGWYGIKIGLDPDEINELIDLLKMLKEESEQHFHIRSDYRGEEGVGDIEIHVRDGDEVHNMSFSGRAYLPGETIEIGSGEEPGE